MIKIALTILALFTGINAYANYNVTIECKSADITISTSSNISDSEHDPISEVKIYAKDGTLLDTLNFEMEYVKEDQWEMWNFRNEQSIFGVIAHETDSSIGFGEIFIEYSNGTKIIDESSAECTVNK